MNPPQSILIALLARAEGETFTLRRGKGEPVALSRADLLSAIGGAE